MDHLEELQALRRELEQANYEYYVQDAPAMSDYDYDHKLRRLEELEGEHPELITPDSPTQRVGGKALESFQQVIHQVPLESLQDVFDYDELRQFDQRVRAAVPGAEAFRFRQDGIHWEVLAQKDRRALLLSYDGSRDLSQWFPQIAQMLTQTSKP